MGEARQSIPVVCHFSRQRRTETVADEQAELARMLRCAASLVESVQRKRVQLSPQRLLYPELLGQVFERLAEEDRPSFTFPEAMARAPAIFQVCRRWRHTAFQTGKLFTIFSIMDPERYKDTPQFISRMKRWLSLSHNEPLEFEYGLLPGGDLVPPISTGPLAWAILLREVSRWKKIDCWLCSTTYIEGILNTRMAASKLEILIIRLYCSPQPSRLEATSFSPLDLPCLRTMHIHNIGDVANLSLLQFKAPRLVTSTLIVDLNSVRNFNNRDADTINAFSAKITHLEITRCRTWHIFHERSGIAASTHCLHLPDLRHCKMESSIEIDMCLLVECTNLTSVSLEPQSFMSSAQLGCTTVLTKVTSLTLNLRAEGGRSMGNMSHILIRFPALESLDLVFNGGKQERGSCKPYLTAFENEACCTRLKKMSISKAHVVASKLLMVVSRRSTEQLEGRAFLITLRDCWGVPDMESVDCDQLQDALREAMEFDDFFALDEDT